MSYLGLDIGTTGCKAVVFDPAGRPISSAYRDYPVLSPREGWAEIDSELVCERCIEMIREAVGASGSTVRGMCISSQGEAFTPVGSDGKVLGNAMVSSDSRAAEVAERFSGEFGRQRLYRITGHTPSPMFTLSKLLWLRENAPETWACAKAFHCFEDLMHRWLGLEPAISWPLAGRTMLFDVREHRWNADILSAIGLDACRLARPLPSGGVVGEISSSVARELGMGSGVKVVAGGHDQTCGALGAGVVSEGRAVYGIGTVECITPAFGSPIFSEELFANNLATYDFTVRGMYTTVAYSLTGGNLLQWFRDQWGATEVEQAHRTGQSAYTLLLETMPDEPTTLLVLPYFTASGTPHFDVDTPGAITGLRLTTTRQDILKALLEGVTFEMRLNLEILERSGVGARELTAIGGGARNRKWLQLKADALNRPIAVAEVTEAGCMGAAMLAMAADTGRDVAEIAREWVRMSEVIEPDGRNAEAYRARFEDYLRLYPALRALQQRRQQ